jgi:hypothetical protein
MLIRELFEPGKKWQWEFTGSEEAIATFHVGEVPYMFHAYGADGEWEAEFKQHGSKLSRTQKFGLTGTGNSAEVMGTVVDIMRAFLAKYQDRIQVLTFSAKEDSRQGLYARMVKRLLPTWTMKQSGEHFVLAAPTKESVGERKHDPLEDFAGLQFKTVNEARTNPDQNVKYESGMKELVAVAKTIADTSNWAISMTSEDKLGINPQVGISEDTPKGIYFYPLDYAVDIARRGKHLPWGHDYPYIQLFQYDRSREMTKDTQVDPTKLKQALKQYCSDNVIQQAIDEPEYDGTPYWTIYDCLSRLGKSDETNVVRWNKVLRDLGFTSVFDPGKGWIAYNEPTQGVVLDPRIIKQLKTIINKKEARVVTPAKIEQTIFEVMDMELAANRAWQAYDPDGSKLRAAAKEYAKDPKFKPYMGKPGTEEIYDKASGFGRWGARQLSDEAWAWYRAQRPQQAQ